MGIKKKQHDRCKVPEFKMNNLIPVINKLQKVFNAAGTALIQLPQIVVVGMQSSGKSSVLEGIVGRQCLPRGIGIVTRCPIVIQMIQMDPEDETYLRKSDELRADEWVEFPHLPQHESIVKDFDKIPNIITEEVTKRAGESNGIIKEEIILRIISPHVINLTLVDLPGITYNPTGEQPTDIEEQITDLISFYISNPNSIILAVSAASNDIAGSKSIKLAKTVDPNCDRTIAVLTKLDLMDRGTDALEELTGKKLKVKLGIIGVVNRSYDDSKNNISIETSIRNEAAFLLDKYPTIASRNGITFLKIRLQKLLMEHIKKCLPSLQTRLTSLQIKARNDLKELGAEIPTNKSAIMLDIIENFCKGFKGSILGENRNIEKKFLNGSFQIDNAFEEKLNESLKKILPSDELQDMEILTAISNSHGIEGSVLALEAAYQDLVRDQIYRLEAPALQCAEYVNTAIISIMQLWVKILEKQMQRFPNLTAAICLEVTEMLNERHLQAQKLLQNYVEIQASFIKTIQMDFNTQMLELLQKNPSLKTELYSNSQGDLTDIQKTYCGVVRQLVDDYFHIVKTAFQDYCPKAIAHSVIYFMEKNIQRHLVEKLFTPEKVDQLIQESTIVADQRKLANDRIQALDSYFDVIRDIRETYF